jgi:hypothetical protein
MKDPISFLLSLLGYEYNRSYKNSLIFMHMIDVTHEGYFDKHMRHGTFENYLIKKI